MPFQNPSPEAIKALLARVNTIAVVGLSPQPKRPSYVVAKAMQGFGYRIIPVRPLLERVLDEPAYASLSDVPEHIDLVDVFRAAEYLDELVDECIRLKLPALWVQEGIVRPSSLSFSQREKGAMSSSPSGRGIEERAEAAAERARAAGMFVVMDRCLHKDYVALMV